MGIESIVNASTGRRDQAVVVKRTSEDQWEYVKHDADFKKFTKEEIIQIVKDSGIVGLGGAMFPTHIKMSIPDNKVVDYLIINGAECEPYITIDERIMREKANEIIKGIEIMDYVLNPKKIFIGIENNKPEAIETLKKCIKN